MERLNNNKFKIPKGKINIPKGKINIPKKKINKKATAVIAVFVGIVCAVIALIGLITDFIWFKEIGYVSVMMKKIVTQIEIAVPVFIVMSLITFFYLKSVKKAYLKHEDDDVEINHKMLKGIEIIFTLMFGGASAYFSFTNLWKKLLEFLNSTDFGITDPLFSKDVSFYVFGLPFIKEVTNICIVIIAAFALITILYTQVLKSAVKSPEDEEEITEEETEPEYQEYTIIEEEPEPEYDEYEVIEEEPAEPVSVLEAEADNSTFTEAFGSFKALMVEEKRAAEDAEFRKERKKKDKAADRAEDAEVGHIIFEGIIGRASVQFIVLGLLLFGLIAFHFYLKQFAILHAHTGAVFGAGFTDVKVSLLMYRLLIGLAVISAATFITGILRKNLFAMYALPLVMVIVFGIGEGSTFLVQNYIVSPDELNKEAQYLEYNIEFTQHAYGLDNVLVKNYAANKKLDGEDILNNSETISNVRINDYQPTQKLYNQTQSIRQYYDFNDVDVDRYMIDGKYTQTYLSAREINEENISKTFVNSHLKYTHGYGVALSRVDKVTASGQADVLVGNIPPESLTKDIAITNPAIYFGELSNDWIIVGADEKEFDYPDGSSNQYTKYTGSAGIKMNLINRVLFAIKEKSLKLLVSSNISGDSKMLIYRNIEQRVKKIMPYIYYEQDPYMVTVNGNLYWMIDAYTTSADYPYSAPYTDTSDTNYVRNSIKVVVDAYNGDVNYYIVDPTDPLAQTYKKIYPKLFKDISEMDDALRSHIRYPDTLFDIQATVYNKYHMEDVSVFYQNEDLWSIAHEIYGTEEKEMTPNYYILKLPGEKNAEFVSMIPYTPKNKKNMTSILVARNDGDNYGQLILYQFPKSKVVYGPMQVEALIDQNTKISQDFSLWTSNGTSYSRGNLFVIPIEESILYVEPVYLEAKNSSIPEVKKVIVVFGDKIAYEGTFAEALNSMFNTGTSSDNDTETEGEDMSRADLIKAAQDTFNKAEAASRSGDWAAYGKYVNELQKYLSKLQ